MLGGRHKNYHITLRFETEPVSLENQRPPDRPSLRIAEPRKIRYGLDLATGDRRKQRSSEKGPGKSNNRSFDERLGRSADKNECLNVNEGADAVLWGNRLCQQWVWGP